MDTVQQLKVWSRRADVHVDVIGGEEVLRFGKGGGRGARGAGGAAPVPYHVPAWVRKRISAQRARLAETGRLKGYVR